MTPNQIRMVHGLIRKLPVQLETKDLAITYSSGRTESLSDLTYPESNALINFLQKEVGQTQTPLERMQRKILSMAHEMRWELPGGKVDMEHLNNWCRQYGYLHKPFNDYTEAELPKLVTQFEGAYKGFSNR